MKPMTMVKQIQMNSVYGFAGAALPWIAIGLLWAVYFAITAKRKKTQKKEEDNSSEGMYIGMCFGVAVAAALHINISIGMMLGMLLGFLIGLTTEKEKNK